MVSTHESTPTLGQVAGQNLRRLRTREHLTQADVTRRIFDMTGERWTPDQVSILENGKRGTITLEDLLVLAHAFGVPLAEFFDSGFVVVGEGDEDLAKRFVARAGKFVVTLEGVRQALSGDRMRSAFGSPDTSTAVLEWLESQVEADKAVADRLGVDLQAVVDAAVKMWGHTLTEERDAQLGDTSGIPPRSVQGKRGAMTRVLTARIEAALRVEGKIS
jgi:transcriptional regulator with XRE-family HTH domain